MTKVVVVNGELGESDNSKLILEVPGAEYIGILNSSLVKVKNNFAPLKKRAQIIGSVGVQPNYTSFKSLSNYIQTDIREQNEMTTFVVAKTATVPDSTASAVSFIANYKSPPLDGSTGNLLNSFYFGINSAGKLMTISLQGNNATDASPVAAASGIQTWTANEYHLVAARLTNTRVQHWDKTKNYSIYADLTKPRYLAANKLRIGSTYTDFTGDVDIALLIHYPRALSDSEIDTVTAWIRNYMAGRGITV
ncbi:hypothetical protein F3P16_06160 [Acinetobacter baumannii]|uniref:hypothetical protein n=1 Tax=Acinetobacter baumannii TaxID=470 RepID=UPI001238EBFE|nr:hypothetical protein [Acinetobacter baumannii]QER74755.1 hypothetical protein F3P16_06160 [Acinetobacter baumannii]